MHEQGKNDENDEYDESGNYIHPVLAAMRMQSNEEIMNSLWDLINTEFKIAFDLFCEKLHRSPQHEQSITVFKLYYDVMEDALENNIDILSSLATVFVDEPNFKAEYNRVCSRINKYLARPRGR